MDQQATLDSSATFLPIARDEVARLVLLAAGRIGWRTSRPRCDARDRWEADVESPSAPFDPGRITLEATARSWTSVRLHWPRGVPGWAGGGDRFLRALVALSYTAEPGGGSETR